MEIGQDLPIVSVCIVSDPTKLPPNYTLIDKSHDKCDDADLWKDGLWGRRVMRYLCVQRQIPTNTEDVLVDVTLINERDDPPPGFTILDTTHDSGEKATKKRSICLRWMVPSMTADAITELVFINRAQRRAPVGYTMVGDINNMSLCYKMGKVPSPASSDQGSGNQGMQGLAYGMTPSGAGLPYQAAPSPSSRPVAAGRSSAGLGINTSVASGGSSHLAGGAMSPPTHVTPLSGVQWKMNARYCLMMELQNLTIPEIRGKTLNEIERQYEYSFELEKSVSKAEMVS